MIIECYCGKKKFNIPDEQIPATGRNLQCVCSKVWFYQPDIYKIEQPPIEENQIEVKSSKKSNLKNKFFESFKKKIQPMPIVRRNIYLSFLFFFSVTALAAAFESNVLIFLPFLKFYLDVINVCIVKVLQMVQVYSFLRLLPLLL